MTEIKSVTALNRVLPQGMKTIGFELELDRELSSADLAGLDIEVLDHSYEPEVSVQARTVTGIYLRDRAAVSHDICAGTDGADDACGNDGAGIDSTDAGTEKRESGRFLIIETDPEDAAAYAIGNYTIDGTFTAIGPPPLGLKEPERHEKPEPGADVGNGPGKDFGYTGIKPLNVEIRIRDAEGEASVTCTDWICPELDRFEVRDYKGLKYDLFIPEGYDPSKKYPVVLFIVDAGARGTYEKIPLAQGIGAVVWTSPEDQAKHPCFVVSPVFGPQDILTHDDFTFDRRLYLAKEILDALRREFSIDPDRIYTTGQSMGCMSSCQLMVDFPEYFAGAMLVAGQWDPEKCGKAMKDSSVWILVSEHDMKAHPGMDAVTAAIEAEGTPVDRFRWDAKAPHAVLEKEAEEAAASPSRIKYTVFKGSSVVPDGMDDGPGANHTSTWPVAYSIEAVRDWLFTAHRKR